MSNKFQELLESSKYAPLSELDKNTLGAIMANTERETAQMIAEGTISADIAQFTPFLMPMLRRIYPSLIANELLGVQPMSGPTGFIYNLTNRFVGNQANPINPNVKAQILDFADVSGLWVGNTVTSGSAVVGTIVYIEPTDFTIAGEKPGTAQGGIATTTFTDKLGGRVLVELADQTIFFNALAGAETVVISQTGSEGVPTDGTGTIVRTFSSEASWLGLLPQYSGSYTTANGEIRGTVGNEMNEVGIAVERKQIEARTRKLRAEYTIEMYQDLKAMHGVLADQELMALMGYEIKAQTDREVVDFVNGNASVEVNEFKINNGATAGDVTNPTVQDGRWELEKYRMFATKLSDMSRELGRLNRRGAGNKLLVSPKVVTMLEQIGGFTASDVASSVNPQIANGGVVGRFDNKFNVVVDNYAVSEYATVIYKGSNQDSIGVYAPYTPVQIQKVTHVTTGQPALIAMTRYGLTTNPWQDSAKQMGEKSPYASMIGVDFSNTVLA